MTRRLVWTLLVLTTLAGWVSAAAAEDLIRLSRNVPGDSKPIGLHADEIVSWTEGNERVFLLRGQALVEQGVLRVWLQQGIVWVNMQHYQATHVFQVEFYAEGDVRLENGAAKQAGSRALVELNTRGELRVKGKVTEQKA